MIHNKKIEGMLRQTTETLKGLLGKKDELMEMAKSKLDKTELKEFTALERMVNTHLSEGDYNGALKTISKYQTDKLKNDAS